MGQQSANLMLALRSRLTMVLVASSAVACSDEITQPEKLYRTVTGAEVRIPNVLTGQYLTHDDKLEQVARVVPEFAGIFQGPDGRLRIVLTDVVKAPQARAAVAGAFGLQNLSALESAIPVEGTYSFRELRQWYRIALRLAATDGRVVETDIDEVDNLIRIGVVDRSAESAVRTALEANGVPAGMLRVETTGPIWYGGRNSLSMPEANHGNMTVAADVAAGSASGSEPGTLKIPPCDGLCDTEEPPAAVTIRDYVRPLRGGIIIRRLISPTEARPCTIGFVGTREAPAFTVTPGIVTNSHCTDIRFGLDNTRFFQNDPTNSSHYIGTEAYDPAPYACSYPGGRCRSSDATWVEIRSSNASARLGLIARTTADKFTLADESMQFRSTAENWKMHSGFPVQRVGSASGTVAGAAAYYCTDYFNSTANVWLVCQGTANLPSDLGDSGAPVFELLSGNDVSVHGLFWGGLNCDANGNACQTAVFSPSYPTREELGGSVRPLYIFY